MRYSKIRKMDIVNGIGISCSIFFQGCSHHCKGCFNEDTWDFCAGKYFDKETEDTFIELCKNKHINAVSILGGEPLDQDNEEMFLFLSRIKSEVNKPIYLWTGYIIEEIKHNKCISIVDVLIDGKFEEVNKDINLYLRGSSNQNIYKKGINYD